MSLFGIQGASDIIGTIELATAAALISGAFVPAASALGAAMSSHNVSNHADVFCKHAGRGRADGRRVSGDFRADRAIPS